MYEMLCISLITNMSTVGDFEVISKKFNLYSVCP
jgi:hypothetical protein